MEALLWAGFLAFVFVMLALDLGVFHRDAHVIRPKEALVWTGFTVVLAVLFTGVIYYLYDQHVFDIGSRGDPVDKRADGTMVPLDGVNAAVKFFGGYLIEMSLSLDNIFVIALIFSFFRIPLEFQHRVLFWGILGALLMRGAMIGAGSWLLHQLEWTVVVFGLLLLYTATKMLRHSDDEVDPNNNILVRIARRFYPLSDSLDGQKFFTRLPDGRKAMTPMFLVLLVVESTDVLFAVDSIPAVFSLTQDPFLVFTSNVFAILALRSMYFALSSILDQFRFLKFGLCVLLLYIGVKLIVAPWFKIPSWVSLVMIVATLFVAVSASLWATRRERRLADMQAASQPGADSPDDAVPQI